MTNSYAFLSFKCRSIVSFACAQLGNTMQIMESEVSSNILYINFRSWIIFFRKWIEWIVKRLKIIKNLPLTLKTLMNKGFKTLYKAYFSALFHEKMHFFGLLEHFFRVLEYLKSTLRALFRTPNMLLFHFF